MSLISRSRSVAASAKHRLTTRWQIHAAVAQARAFARRTPHGVRVSWDLDNTLADTGSLLRGGKGLADAIVEAQPVTNMPRFFRAMQEALPDAEHFILSARLPSMRVATEAWLRDHLGASDWNLCFVPDADAKLEVWRSLRRNGRLVIVDDLSYGHEDERPSVYEQLVEHARRLAEVYIGLEEIDGIAGDEREGAAIIVRVSTALAHDDGAL